MSRGTTHLAILLLNILASQAAFPFSACWLSSPGSMRDADKIPYNCNLNPLYLIEKIRKTVDGHWFGAILAYSLSSYFCQLGGGGDLLFQ